MFIFTHDKEMIEKLIHLKYPVMKQMEVNGKTIYCFKNINRLVFSYEEKKKIAYSNKLFL